MPLDLAAEQWPAGVELLDELGRGADSIVYRVERDGAQYALKVLRTTADRDEMLVAFRREAALLATLRHPGLARVHDIGALAGRPYLVMDLVAGRPLADLLAEGPLPPDAAIALAADVAGVLVAVHRVGLVHRDVKPQNIVIDPQGVAHLIDFGMAAREQHELGDRVTGTLAYAAPEQAGTLRRAVDGRADLYALGVVLFESLAGRLPFSSDDVGELLRMHAGRPAPDLVELVPGIAPALARCVARLLAKDPDDRYPSAAALLADLLDLAPDLRRGLPAAATTAIDGVLGQLEQAAGTDVPLCGRENELAVLADRWQSARAGRGGAVLITAPSGAGKKRLARELAGAARVTGVVLRAGCSRDDQAPMTALRTAVEGYARQVAALPAAEREPAVARLRVAAGPMPAVLTGLSGTLTTLLGGAEGLPEEDRQQQFEQAVADFLARLAIGSGGLLLLLDAVEWLDAGSCRVLRLLADRLPSLPLLVLGTARVQDEGSEQVAAFTTAVGEVDPLLELSPLDAAGVRELLAAVLTGAGTTPRLPAMLAVRSNGNPFVVLEYLRAIVDAGLLRPSWGSWELDEDGLDALDLPQDALGLVLSRVEGLGGQVQRVLTAAAAVGGAFGPGLLARICELDESVIRAVLVEAAARRLVERRDGDLVGFVHDKIRECLLQPVPVAELAPLHARIAAALESDPQPGGAQVYAVARHHLAAGALAPRDRLFAACVAAGRQALAEHDAVQAVSWFEHAVGAGEVLDTEVRHAHAVALARSGRYAEAVEELEQVLQGTHPPLVRAALLAELAEVYRATWALDRAGETVRLGLAELGVPMPQSRSARWLLALARGSAGIFVGPGRPGRGGTPDARRERMRLITVLHQVGAFIATMSGSGEDLVVHNLCAIRPRNRLGGGAEYARSTGGAAFLLAVLGMPAVARFTLRRAEQAAVRTGDPRVVAQAHWYAGSCAYASGQDDGEAWLGSLEQHGRWLDVGQYSDAVTAVCWELALKGRTADVDLWLDRARAVVESRGRDEVAALMILGAVLRSLQGRPAEAAEFLGRARRTGLGQRSAGSRTSLEMAQLRAHLEQSELGEPFELSAAFVDRLRLRRRGVMRPIRLVVVPVALARLAQCRSAGQPGGTAPKAAIDRAARAVAAIERVAGTPLERGYLCVLKADLEVLRGRPGRALRLLSGRLPLQPEAPLVEFEALRVRARALLALDRPEAGLREAAGAHALAMAQTWPHRARWVSAEFGPVTPADRSSGAIGSGSRPLLAVPSQGGAERQRLAALEAVSRAAARLLHPDEVARVALDETIRILGAERAFLFLADDTRAGEHRPLLVPRLGRDGSGHDVTRLTGYSASLVERVRVTGEPLVVTGTEEGAAMGAGSVVLNGLRSILIAPLMLDGRLLGVVYLDSQLAKGIFTAEDVGILAALTTYVATSLATARAAQLEISVQTARRERELAELLRTAITEMSATLVPDDVLERLLDAAVRVLPARQAWLVTRRGPDLVARSQDPADAQPRLLGPAAEGALGPGGGSRVGSPSDPLPGPLAMLAGEPVSWLLLPLTGSDGALGALLLTSDVADVYGGSELQLAATLGAQALTAYERALLFARVQELAIADELTGVPNRRHFFELAGRDLSSAQRHGHPLFALMVDIDHFKRVNDSHGHPVGDEVIREVARRLAAELRGTDIVGRYGGEEFAVILNQTRPDEIGPTAERLRRAVADRPIPTRVGPLPVTVSIGAARLSAADGDVPDLLARADRALYRAKRDGRDRVELGG